MSIERDRVSHAMFRSICCCFHSRTGKVHDDDMVVEFSLAKNVLLILTEQTIASGLVGKLVTSLEEKKLKSIHMRMIRPTPEKLMKSDLVKAERKKNPENVWMIFVWRGENAQGKVMESVKSFRTQYALPKNAVYFTDSSDLSINEQKLWFADIMAPASSAAAPSPAPIVANGDVERDAKDGELIVEQPKGGDGGEPMAMVVENLDGQEEGHVDIHVIPSSENGIPAEAEYSSEGPQPSVNSSQLPSHQSPEVAIVQQPVVELPEADKPLFIESTAPGSVTLPPVITNQPTKVEVHPEVS